MLCQLLADMKMLSNCVLKQSHLETLLFDIQWYCTANFSMNVLFRKNG